jgi:deoxycytidylate deaminase
MSSNKLFEKFYPNFYQEAIKSTVSTKLAAGILKGKKIVGKICCNTNRNLCRGIFCGSVHAEANALLNYFGKSLQFDSVTYKWCIKTSYKKLNLIVFRVNSEGNTANARPCYNCLNMMKDIGIKKIYYSTDNYEEIICENVKNMISIQSSSFKRFIDTNNKKNNNNKELYFESLLKKYFPKKVREKNLYYFLHHNFKNIFPEYNVIINNKNNSVQIYDNKNIILVKSQIIFPEYNVIINNKNNNVQIYDNKNIILVKSQISL